MSSQSKTESMFIIRDAQPSDCQAIYSLICELAQYEKMLDQVEITAKQLEEDGFGNRYLPYFHSLIVEKVPKSDNPNVDHRSKALIVGFLLYVQKYSTFKGPFLWIEDLYIKPEYRRQGLGKSLISVIVRKAHQKQMPRIEWNVLKWNQLAIGFYQHKLGAIDMTNQEDWLLYRLNRDRFEQLLDLSPTNVRIEVE